MPVRARHYGGSGRPGPRRHAVALWGDTRQPGAPYPHACTVRVLTSLRATNREEPNQVYRQAGARVLCARIVTAQGRNWYRAYGYDRRRQCLVWLARKVQEGRLGSIINCGPAHAHVVLRQ